MGWYANPTTTIRMPPDMRLAVEQMSDNVQQPMSELIRKLTVRGMKQVHKIAERDNVELRVALRRWLESK